LTYVGYTPDGYDLFSVPFDASQSKAIDQSLPPAGQADRAAPHGDADSQGYRPWRTLAPTSWTPVVASDAGEVVVGAGTATNDALGRHAYAVDAEWAADRARPDWH